MEQQKQGESKGRSILEEKEYEFCEVFDSKRDGRYGRLTGVRVRSGIVIDAIRFDYDGKSNKPLYGGIGGTLSEFKFEEGEYIKSLHFTMGLYKDFPVPVVCYLVITTSKNRTFQAGTEGNCREEHKYWFREKEGMCWHSFQGKYEKYLIDLPKAGYRKEGEYHFDDTAFAQDKCRVSEIRLYSGWVVDGIQIVYDGDREATHHGGKSGTYQFMKLAKGEYITSIEGAIGDYKYQGANTLCKLTIRTNKGASISGGTCYECKDMKEFCYKAESGEQIFAIAGKYRGYMEEISIGMYAGEMEVPDLEQEKQKHKRILLSEIGIQAALESGCYSKSEIEMMWERTLRETESGSTTNRVLNNKKDKILGSKLTRASINAPQYVFRAVAATEERKLIKERREVVSKAQRGKIFDKPIITIEQQNTSQREAADILRILATKASNTPLSQFVSHAFDFKTANRLGDMIVAYRVVPNSPFMGLNEKMQVGQGEDQLQILGGTKISDLHIYKDSKWYKVDEKGNEIKIINGKRPVNEEYNQLLNKAREEYEREL